MKLLCYYYVIIMLLLCYYYVFIKFLYRLYTAFIMFVSKPHRTHTIPSLYPHNTHIVPTQYPHCITRAANVTVSRTTPIRKSSGRRWRMPALCSCPLRAIGRAMMVRTVHTGLPRRTARTVTHINQQRTLIRECVVGMVTMWILLSP